MRTEAEIREVLEWCRETREEDLVDCKVCRKLYADGPKYMRHMGCCPEECTLFETLLWVLGDSKYPFG